ncbi:MAG: hypothetical protein WB048_10275, partial [Pseudolabrys sp.]
GHIVRPGHDYIVVTRGELPESHACMTPCEVECEGVKVFRVQLMQVKKIDTVKADADAQIEVW